MVASPAAAPVAGALAAPKLNPPDDAAAGVDDAAAAEPKSPAGADDACVDARPAVVDAGAGRGAGRGGAG